MLKLLNPLKKSTRLSNDFIASTHKFIEAKYGKEYIGFVKPSKKNDNVQDAHEAIRPTSIERTPESVKPFFFIKSLTISVNNIINFILFYSLSGDLKLFHFSFYIKSKRKKG